MSTTTDRPAIITRIDMDATPEWRWEATFGPYDLDDPVGRGATEAAAIADLKWRINEQDAEL